MLVYKIFRPAEWQALVRDGATDGAPVDLADGFIHLSSGAQVRATAAKWFAGEDGLVLAALEAGDLGPALRWEPARDGQPFPHLYRRLALAEVRWHAALPAAAGGHVFPDGIP